MMINPQGDVYPCLSFKIGNVKDKKLKMFLTKQNLSVLEKILNTLQGFQRMPDVLRT